MRKINFKELSHFHDKQLEAQNELKKFKYLLYGGAAGGGKSYWLRWIALRQLMYYAKTYGLKGVRVGLFCEDYPALKERHLSKVPFEFPNELGDLNRSDHEFRLKPQYGSGVIAFRNLDDPSKYLSSEFASILVDELTKNQRETFDFLNMRLRWPGIPDTKFAGATNPGGVGHGWVKKLWIDRDFEEENYDQNEFGFVQAKHSDNPSNDESYGKTLSSLPDKLRRAYKDGDWDVFAGQYFTEFRRSIHVCEPFEIPDHFRKIICMDYGYSKPSCLLWIAFDPKFEVAYVYREIYLTEQTYKDLSGLIQDTGDIQRIYADPAIWAKKDSPKSGYTEMIDNLPEGSQIYKADNARVIGWGVVREFLKTYEVKKKVRVPEDDLCACDEEACNEIIITEQKAKLRVFNTCRNLIRTLPEQVYDERKQDDIDTNGEDHAVDALRYGLMALRNLKIQTKPMSYSIKSGRTIIQSSDFAKEFDKEEDNLFTFN